MIDFGKKIELMVDDYLIEQKHNLTFRYQFPTDEGRVITFEKEWEQAGSSTMTVLQDEQNIKCYYRGFPADPDPEGGGDLDVRQTSCLSVSDDGVHFTPYPVNEIVYDEIRENNIVRMDTFCHNFAPFYDTNPNCDPKERYKAIGGVRQQGGIHVFGSPDGIHWNMLADGPVITKGDFDSMNRAFWSPETGLYHCYSRVWLSVPTQDKCEDEPKKVRAIQFCTSSDFIHWSEPVKNEYADGPLDELYTNAATPVPGAEHLVVSIPMRFHATRQTLPNYPEPGISDAILMTSRDGIHWSRPVKDAWLTGGPDNDREWTQRNFITAGGIIEHDNKHYFYIQKHFMWDDCGIWAYSVPKYRLMSLYADGDGGSFVTKPLHFESDSISLNCATSAYGSIRVTVRDTEEKVLFVSDEIYGNTLSHTLTFEGLAGTEGTLLIEMQEAHLYAIGASMK